jgi:hypothetical protein
MTSVELYWIPLGADGNPLVRWGGRLYEALVARRDHRPAQDLYHSALVVRRDDGTTHAIEMAPVWSDRHPDRGVVAEGAVGLPWLGRLRMFRYEIRCWRDGVIPDLDAAVGDPVRFDVTEHDVDGLLAQVRKCPTPTWGLDELGTGEMWNSNSLISWALVGAGVPLDAVAPPLHGRAPGWGAGLRIAVAAGH